MTHGHEKSDSVIVAAKPTNNAEQPAAERCVGSQPAAEPVEQRAETKGNASQQSTRRAQSRVSVSQALERIRKVARERKEEKFTALLHHISVELLETAFFELKEDCRAGCGPTDVDGLRDRPRAQSREPARPGPAWSVSGIAEPAGLHTQAGWPAASARGRGSRGQDRPTGCGRPAECDLRGRLPWHLVWIPAGTRHA